jgi:predicted RNA binding protein YcfA (HicA-like mRNA interferase family)
LTKVPSLHYKEIVAALERDGWFVVRQKGSHIRLHKRAADHVLKLTIPAHKPVKRSTLSHIIKQARLTTEQFRKLLK